MDLSRRRAAQTFLSISPRSGSPVLGDLRKGQKVSFEIFDNQGKAAAKICMSLPKTIQGII
jgi:hypothetical protein